VPKVVADQPEIGEADEKVQNLLDEHRQCEPQHGAKRAGRVDEGFVHAKKKLN
jgi:hypothetical protein